MSDGSTARDEGGARAGISERPARIQELRDAVGGEGPIDGAPNAPDRSGADPDGDAAEAARLREALATPPPTSVAAPVAPEDPPGPGRAGLVFVVVAVVVLVLVGAYVVLGRSSTPEPAAAPLVPAVTTSVLDPARDEAATAQRTAALCDAAEVYAVDDLLQLGRNIAATPDAVLAAYETMLVSSPAELRPLLDEMGPLTRKAVAEVEAGRLTTDLAVQAWLAAAPPAELEAWVAPQQELAPKVVALCSTR